MSNESKHTPGPWTVCIGSSGATIYPDNNANHPLVLHFEWSDEPGNGALIMEAQANAALIARAPDLLAENEALRAQAQELREALLHVVSIADEQFTSSYSHRPQIVRSLFCGPAWDDARAALEKVGAP